MKALYRTAGPTFGDERERLREPKAFVAYLRGQFDDKEQQIFGHGDVFRIGGMLNMSYPEMEKAGLLLIGKYHDDGDYFPTYKLDANILDLLEAQIAADAARTPGTPRTGGSGSPTR